MSSITSIVSQDVRRVLMNRCLTKSVLAINLAAAPTIKTTNAITYTVDGVLITKAALAAQSMAVTHSLFGDLVAVGPAAFVQPALTTVMYVVALNAAGVVAVVQGSYAGQPITFTSDLSKVLVGTGAIPDEPAGYTAFGVIKVALTGAATFTPNTTALDAAGVTATYFDIAILPASL